MFTGRAEVERQCPARLNHNGDETRHKPLCSRQCGNHGPRARVRETERGTAANGEKKKMRMTRLNTLHARRVYSSLDYRRPCNFPAEVHVISFEGKGKNRKRSTTGSPHLIERRSSEVRNDVRKHDDQDAGQARFNKSGSKGSLAKFL